MKKIALLIMLYSLSIHAAVAPMGTETNGGDAVVAEFKYISNEVLFNISQGPLTDEEENILTSLWTAQEKVKIDTQKVIILEGKSVDAINQPTLNPPLITLSYTSWQRLNLRQKRHLVLHELLPVAGHYDKDYKLSSAFAMKSTLMNISVQEIWMLFRNCRTDDFPELTYSDLEHLKAAQFLSDLVHATAESVCTRGLELLVKHNFDMNVCAKDTNLTALQKLKIWERGFRASDFKFRYDRYLKTLIDAGGSITCSTKDH